MISTANLTIQFGPKPLFENVSVKFGGGNRYGLIGANGSGKSTFMKILGGDLAPTSGNVSVEPDVRLGKLRQDQFAFEDVRVIDTVIMGHARLWRVKEERDRIYSLPEMSEDDGMKVADLEVEFAELDGYTAEARAGELLLGVGIPLEQHEGLMSGVAPGWKLRVLLAQALFGDPDVLLLDEPTNNLDINAIRWLEGVLNERNSTMVIISHDRHFLNSVCTHMADLDYGELRLYTGNYDQYMTASTLVRERMLQNNAKKKAQIADLQAFVSRFSANASKARQATSRARQIEKIELEEVKPSSRVSPFIRFDQDKKLYRLALELEGLTKGYDAPLIDDFDLMVEVGERIAIIGPNGIGKTTLLKCLVGELEPDGGVVKWSANAEIGYVAQDRTNDFADRHDAVRVDAAVEAEKRRRTDAACDARPDAVFERGQQQIREGDFRRRRGPHAVRQTDAAQTEHHRDGRTDQPPRHGVDRSAEPRARKLSGHVDLRQPRPRVRLVACDTDHRDDARRHRRLQGQLRRLPAQSGTRGSGAAADDVLALRDHQSRSSGIL